MSFKIYDGSIWRGVQAVKVCYIEMVEDNQRIFTTPILTSPFTTWYIWCTIVDLPKNYPMKVFISFVLFGQKVLLVSRWSFWIWPSLCQSLSVKFVIMVKAQNVTPNIRLVMVILCKKMKWAIACGWREAFQVHTSIYFVLQIYSAHFHTRMKT